MSLLGRPGHVERRCVGLLLAVALAFGVVMLRLGSLQALDAEGYAERGVAQRMRTVPLPAERGSILDRNGNELALSVPQHTIWADPSLVEDVPATAEALAPVLAPRRAADPVAMGEKTLLLAARLQREGRFTYISRQQPAEVADAIADLDLPGVSSYEEPRRFTPGGQLARALVGTVDLDGRGRSGLELQYDERLAGTPGRLLVERSIDGRTIPAGNNRLEPSERGEDLVLTIDRGLQHAVEQSLAATVQQRGAEGGTVVLMDPRNGHVLAMAGIDAEPAGTLAGPASTNLALQSVFEPGSVNKIVTFAAALEEGQVEPDELLSVPPVLELGNQSFDDDKLHGVERWPVREILARSSNVGTIMLAQELGPERLDDWLHRFGLGEPTGLDFPGEADGITRDVEDWSDTSMGAIPIGYENAVNATQLLGAFNAIANGGELVEPSLVQATVGADGERTDVEEPDGRRVVSEETAAQMVEMLTGVVHTEEGTGINAQVGGYTVAGKTGTARKVDGRGIGYEPGAYMATFAGFLPAEDPQLSAIVVLDEPRPRYHGGEVAAPLFASIAAAALHHLRIAPAGGAASAGAVGTVRTQPTSD